MSGDRSASGRNAWLVRGVSARVRFWATVNLNGPGGCWLWEGGRQKGYGVFSDRGTRTTRNAHRLAYEWKVGPVPDGLVLDHLCRVRHCVNPAHLEPVTPRENIIRGVSLVAINARKTHCKRGHEFTSENTIVAANGSRQCRTCRRDATRNRRARTRTAA